MGDRTCLAATVLAALVTLSACGSGATDASSGRPVDGDDWGSANVEPELRAAAQTCARFARGGERLVSYGPAQLGSVRHIAREAGQTLDAVWDRLPSDHVVAYCSFAHEGRQPRSVVVDDSGRMSDEVGADIDLPTPRGTVEEPERALE